MLLTAQCITLSEQNFRSEVLAAQTPVLINCWASWCGSFQPMDSVYDELAIAFAGQLKVARLDVATADKLAVHYGIRAVPTLLLFHRGQVLERLIGSVNRQDLAGRLSLFLAGQHSSRSRIACL